MAAPNNDLFENAWDITIAGPGYQYLSGPVSNADYTQSGDHEPATDGGVPWFRSAWWKYVPAVSGTWTVSTNGSSIPGTFIMVKVYRLEVGGDLTLLGLLESTDVEYVSVTAATTYYLRVGCYEDLVGDYAINAEGPYTAMPVNDLRSGATDVTIYEDGGSFEAAPTPVDLLTATLDGTDDLTTGATDVASTYQQSAWWKYEPQSTGSLTINLRMADVSPASSACVIMYGPSGGDPLASFGYHIIDTATSSTVTSGDTYYLAAVNRSGSEMAFRTYRMTLTGPATTAPPPDPNLDVPPISTTVGVEAHAPILNVPPISATLSVRGRITGEVDTVEMPPVGLTASVHGVTTFVVPPITVGASTPPGELLGVSIILTAPDDNEIVPTARPSYVIAVRQDDETLTYTVEVQWASDTAFTTDVHTMSADCDPIEGGVTITPDTDLPSTTYWRARVLLDGDEVLGYTAYRTVTVNAASGGVELIVTWTVADVARPIHLWHVDPPSGEPGDVVTIYGQGFPTAPGTVTLDGDAVAIESWTLVAASAATDDRVITGNIVDPEHFEVDITIPDIDEPGGVLVVEA